MGLRAIDSPGVEPGALGGAGHRTGRSALRFVVVGVVIGISLILTVVRHEALHVVGARLTGNMVTQVEWLPRAGTLGAVEIVPPLVAGPVSYYVPLCLPYAVDLLLVGIGLFLVRRFNFSPTTRWLIVQHTVYFAALDILVNCAAAFVWPNDWALIFAGSGGWQTAALGLVMALSIMIVAIGRWHEVRFRLG